MKERMFSPLVLALGLLVAAVEARAGVVVVSPVGTPAENGTALLNALAGIADASESNPYLLKIEPGKYDLGTKSLRMKPHVDIEGSGQFITTIIGAGRPEPGKFEFPHPFGTVVGANIAGLRSLTVEHTDTGRNKNAIAIHNVRKRPRLTNVRVINKRLSENEVYNYGIYNDAASPTITNAIIVVRGRAATRSYGVYSKKGSHPSIKHTSIVVGGAPGGLESYGIYNDSSFGSISYSSVFAGSAQKACALFNNDESKITIFLSQLSSDDAIICGGGTVKVIRPYGRFRWWAVMDWWAVMEKWYREVRSTTVLPK